MRYTNLKLFTIHGVFLCIRLHVTTQVMCAHTKVHFVVIDVIYKYLKFIQFHQKPTNHTFCSYCFLSAKN